MIGPNKNVKALIDAGFLKNELMDGSLRCACSSPTNLLNPPKGMILSEYIVPLNLKLAILGPNPIANSSTPILKIFAETKWPNSCDIMSMLKPTIASKKFNITLVPDKRAIPSTSI
jgi:hypothetical protein